MKKLWDDSKDNEEIEGEQGICPCCGGTNLQYEGPDPVDDQIMYSVDCCDCDYQFKEWYTLTFAGLWGAPLIKKTKKNKK